MDLSPHAIWIFLASEKVHICEVLPQNQSLGQNAE
jgi:hypothetical protein